MRRAHLPHVLASVSIVAITAACGEAPLNRVAEDAAIAPAFFRVPGFGESGVARNAALLTTERIDGAAQVSFDGTTETETTLAVEIVEGITIVRLAEQPAQSDVTVRMRFAGGFNEDMSWTTGDDLIAGPAAPAVITRAEVEAPVFEGRRAAIDVDGDPLRGAAALIALDGVLRTRVSAQVVPGPGGGISFADFTYQGGPQDYEVVSIDRAGNVAPGTPVTVGAGGCGAAPAAPGWLLLAWVALIRRRGARW